jgi:hypothetical protein
MRSRFSLAISVIGLCGCSVSARYSDAQKAIEVFHRLMDNSEYGAIYDNSAKGFQAAASRDVSIGFFSRINRKLGKCGTATTGFGGYQATTGGTYVTINSSRTCANGELDEQFVWLMVGDKATLLKYNANNPLLLTD